MGRESGPKIAEAEPSIYMLCYVMLSRLSPDNTGILLGTKKSSFLGLTPAPSAVSLAGHIAADAYADNRELSLAALSPRTFTSRVCPGRCPAAATAERRINDVKVSQRRKESTPKRAGWLEGWRHPLGTQANGKAKDNA